MKQDITKTSEPKNTLLKHFLLGKVSKKRKLAFSSSFILEKCYVCGKPRGIDKFSELMNYCNSIAGANRKAVVFYMAVEWPHFEIRSKIMINQKYARALKRKCKKIKINWQIVSQFLHLY